LDLRRNLKPKGIRKIVMQEKIHYGIATLCGVSMVGVAFMKSENVFQWVFVIVGLYLISKALLINKK